MTAVRGASFFRRAFARRVRSHWAIGIEAKPSPELGAEEVSLLILDPCQRQTNKCLADSNKSRTAGSATND